MGKHSCWQLAAWSLLCALQGDLAKTQPHKTEWWLGYQAYLCFGLLPAGTTESAEETLVVGWRAAFLVTSLVHVLSLKATFKTTVSHFPSCMSFRPSHCLFNCLHTCDRRPSAGTFCYLHTFPSTSSLPRCSQQLGLGQPETRNLELHLGLQHK